MHWDFRSQQIDSSSRLILPMADKGRCLTKGFGRRLSHPFRLWPLSVSRHSPRFFGSGHRAIGELRLAKSADLFILSPSAVDNRCGGSVSRGGLAVGVPRFSPLGLCPYLVTRHSFLDSISFIFNNILAFIDKSFIFRSFLGNRPMPRLFSVALRLRTNERMRACSPLAATN